MSEVEHPTQLGKYEIRGIAGRGAQGIVYRGYDPFVDREVAIKLCRTGDMAEETRQKLRRHFFNEAQAAGGLDHPNILRVYDAGELEDEPYIVMELVEGSENLRRYTRPDALLPLETVVRYVKECAEALDYAHRHGVTHRDVKPANIMVTPQGTVKLVDFGIAYRSDTERTQLAGSFGSPRYMSPEQALGEEVTPQSDIFSLGVVLFELLTGTVPFEAQNVAAMVYQIVNRPPRPVRSLRPDVPESIAAVVDRALAKDRGERYQSAGEMAADLEAILSSLEAPEEALDEAARLELAAGLAFFEGFSAEALEEAVEEAEWASHAPGTRVLHQGEGPDGERGGLYVIAMGRAELARNAEVLARLGPGECFGELAWLEGTPQPADVVALERLVTLRFEEPVRAWGSIGCQLAFARALQGALARRLEAAWVALADS